MKPRTCDRLAHVPSREYAEQPVPALGFGNRLLTRVFPLGRVPVTERDGELYLGG